MTDTFRLKTRAAAEAALPLLAEATEKVWRLRPGTTKGFKWEVTSLPDTKIVTSLMSGKEVEIATETPLCCDPSSETYWSM